MTCSVCGGPGAVGVIVQGRFDWVCSACADALGFAKSSKESK